MSSKTQTRKRKKLMHFLASFLFTLSFLFSFFFLKPPVKGKSGERGKGRGEEKKGEVVEIAEPYHRAVNPTHPSSKKKRK